MLATSGTTGAEGESIGNSWKFFHLVEAFCTQWCDAALAARGAKARKSEAVVAALDNFDLSELSEAAARIENAISRIHRLLGMKMMPMTTTKKTLTGTLVTVMMSWMTLHTQLVLRQMTQNFLNSLMVIWKMLMRPHLKCMLQQVAVFKKHVSFWLVLRVPECYFPVVGIGAFDGLAQQSTDRKSAKSRGKGNKGKRKGSFIFAKRWKSRQTLLHLAPCQNHRPHIQSLVLRCPRSVRLKLV